MSSIEKQKEELKLQGAVEAASQPESNITAEAAEKVMVEESRKAGAAAYQLDPDASPEETAAQVESQIPPGFYGDRKSKAVGVATDIEDGSVDQDTLPDTIKAAAAATPPVEQNGVKHPAAPLDEEQRWAPTRTGWAPRFVPAADSEDDGPTLLDHQTWIEGILDEKFFGDWYHNAAVIGFACLFSWFIAVLGGGLGWVFLVMACCGTYYRTSVRRVRRNFRDDINREMSKAKLETDTESLEWINSFLVKFWPIYAPVLCDTIINSVDQVLSTATPGFLDSLRMKTFILGTKPPRLEHVKTYPKTEVDTVLMDWKFSFTPNDTMDLTARQLKNKINPKVVLEVRVGKGIVSKGLDVIVEDFAFSGLMRVKVKLQIPFPHIERVDVCFLDRPEIDYVCKPLGGDTLGFDINFIPGLESFIKDQIHGNLQPMMYSPNVFPVEIAKMLAGNPVDQAIGVIAVTIHGAHQLKNTDKFSGTPDPYVVVSINSRTPLGRTKTIPEESNPRWNETIYVIITSLTDALTLQVYDYNEIRKDKELGVATFALEQLEQEQEHENLSLDVIASGRQRGVIQADVRFFPILEGRTLDSGETEPPPELNTGIARFTVEQAKDLDGTKSLVGNLNPYAVLLLNNKEIHITKKLKRTNNPIFQDPSKEILITDRKTARLGLVIKDDRDLSADLVLGTYQIKLNDMLRMMEKGQQWVNLAGAQTGRAKLSLEWKPVALTGISGTAGYVTPVGVVRIHIHGATDLRNLETMGKSDPYVKMMLSGVQKRRTVTFKNNLNPDWDETFYIPVHTPREKLALEVMDEESHGSDRPLGMVELKLSDYMHENEDGEWEVDDEKQLLSSPLRLGGRGQAKGILNYTVAFYPTLNVVDPEEEAEEEAAQRELNGGSNSLDVPGNNSDKDSLAHSERSKTNGRASVDTASSKRLSNGTALSSPKSPSFPEKRGPPKIRLNAEDISQYQCGLLVYKILNVQLARPGVRLEVLNDNHAFPSYSSAKLTSKTATINDVSDSFVRELDVSRITLRLVEKVDTKGDGDDEFTVAKLTGPLLPTIQRCLYTPTELILRADNGEVNKVTVSLRYLPVKMKLDPRESINNMGTLRVDVLDAADLPSADRNGYSDPYCKFVLSGKEVHKTKVQKKTLHPAWNEYFETPIKSRIGADFRVDVYDWDFGEKSDYLGGTSIDLESIEPFQSTEVSLTLDGKSGVIRLKLLFKPDYIARTRQGTSTFQTFSGTFATPGKIIGAPVKGVGFVGGNVIKGASILKSGLKRIGHHDKEPEMVDPPATNGHPTNSEASGMQRSTPLVDVSAPSSAPTTPQSHNRTRSSVSQAGTPRPESGTAIFTILSAAGYPPSANVRVVVKQLTSKGAKEVHKTKAIKSSSADIQFDASHETFKVNNTTADAQFQLRVLDHSMFGSDDVLGEALLFVDDQGTSLGQGKAVKVGSGTVMVKSGFSTSESNLRPDTAHSNAGASLDDSPFDSPDSKKPRRSFLAKRSVSNAGGSRLSRDE